MNILSSEVVITAKELRYTLERLKEPQQLNSDEKRLLSKLEGFKYPSSGSSITYLLTLSPGEQEELEMIVAAVK